MGETTLSLGGNTFQFFTRNPRGGDAKPLDPSDIAAFSEFSVENGIPVILAHAPYTLNPCAAKDSIRDFTKRTMADDLVRLSATPGNLYNFHPGSHVGQGIPEGIRLITETLDEILAQAGDTTVLLETMAGKGSEVGSRFEELAQIIKSVGDSSRLGVCLDTCHVYDAGYDIVNNLEGVLEGFDSIIGLDRLKAVHLNDSKNPFCSHKDRHEKIGRGSIGLDAFSRIINHPALKNLPFYLETPQDDLSGYGEEIRLLKSLYNG